MDARGHWSTVWRGSTDYTFTVRGDVAGPTRTVAVATIANPAPTSATPASTPSVPATPAGPESTTPAATTTKAPVLSATPVKLNGSARPNSPLVVYIRRAGTTAWTVLAATHTDAGGHWSASLRTTGSFEYFAKSANGQASRLQPVSVP